MVLNGWHAFGFDILSAATSTPLWCLENVLVWKIWQIFCPSTPSWGFGNIWQILCPSTPFWCVWTLTRTTQASPTEDQHRQCLHINQLHPTTRKKTKTTIKTMTVTKTITMAATYLGPTFLFNDKQNLEPSYTVRCNWQRKHILVDTVWMIHDVFCSGLVGEKFSLLKAFITLISSNISYYTNSGLNTIYTHFHFQTIWEFSLQEMWSRTQFFFT